MPGKVVSFSVKAGDTVSKGQALAVMEAMKMEHTITAPADGQWCRTAVRARATRWPKAPNCCAGLSTMALRITFSVAAMVKAEPWLSGFRAALPGVDMHRMAPGAPQAEHAVVWSPPQQFLDEQPGCAASSTWGRRGRAAQAAPAACARIVRLDDAGMSVQMAEFVCHAMMRNFREFDLCG
jgi:hypothetical protein